MDCLCDGQVFIFSRSGDQHAALRAAGFRDCVLAGIKLVHLKSLAREHTYLRLVVPKQLRSVVRALLR